MGAISTEGWDTIFALRLPAVNDEVAQAIARGDGRLPDLNWASKDGSAKLTARFGTWSLVADGAHHSGGTLVTMQMPIVTGSFAFMSKAPEPLDGVTLRAQVQLTAIGQQHALVVDATQPVVITSITGPTSPLPDESILRTALTAALAPALGSFKYAFATVNVNDKLQSAVPWLAPKGVAYCYAGGDTDADSFFGTLCMTDGFIAGNPLPPPSMPASLIGASESAVLLLSEALFCRNVLLPGISKGFRSRAFDLVAGDTTIVKRHGSPPLSLGTHDCDLSVLYLPLAGLLATQPGVAFSIWFSEWQKHGDIRLHGNMLVHLEELKICQLNGQLVFTSSLRCDVSTASPFPEIQIATVTFTSTTSYKLVHQPDGKIVFKQAAPATHSTPSVDAPAWLKDTSSVIDVVLGLVASIVIVCTDGIAAVLAAVVYVLLEVELEFLPVLVQRQIRAGASTTAPAGLEQLVAVAAQPILWTSRVFQPTSVHLDGDLAFGGTFAPR